MVYVDDDFVVSMFNYIISECVMNYFISKFRISVRERGTKYFSNLLTIISETTEIGFKEIFLTIMFQNNILSAHWVISF